MLLCISFKPKGCFKTYFYYTRLYKGSFTKEAIDSTLQKVMPFTENNENTIRTVFQFHDPKLIQAGVLNRMSTIEGYVQGTYERRN